MIIGAMNAADHNARAYHVGGTSVRGMLSKPIIDILVCLDDHTALEDIIPDLEHIGYRNMGECGRPGRYFFTSGDQPGRTYYVHLCRREHQVAQDQLLFREMLQTMPGVFQNYIKLKMLLRDAFPDDRYMYRQMKGTFIEGVLSVYRSRNQKDCRND